MAGVVEGVVSTWEELLELATVQLTAIALIQNSKLNPIERLRRAWVRQTAIRFKGKLLLDILIILDLQS
jgi:hypothetical protein